MPMLASCSKCGSENTHVRVFVPREQHRAQQPPGCGQHGRRSVPVVGGKAHVRDLGGQMPLVEPLKLELVHAVS